MKVKNIKYLTFLLIIILISSGCSSQSPDVKTRYSDAFFDTFDTLVQVVAYTDSEAEFELYYEHIQNRFQELHKLYNIYLSYDGVNNVKTINDHAGVAPVVVDRQIIDLILYAIDLYDQTGYTTNIALGPVLQIWHYYRSEAEADPENAQIPPMQDLLEAARHTDLNQVIVDIENNTVFLPDARMRLDVGAVAKGYATELVAQEVEAMGMTSGVLSPGGNVRTIGKPLDGIREKWGIGIQNPEVSIFLDDDRLLDVVFVQDAAVVSSGDYQRYYIFNDMVMHHIIDPATLLPGRYYRSLSVIAADAALADLLSTALFLLPFDESLAMASNFNVDVYWVFDDGRIEITDGMKLMLRSYGVSNELQ